MGLIVFGGRCRLLELSGVISRNKNERDKNDWRVKP